MTTAIAEAPKPVMSLLTKLATKFSVEPSKMLPTLKQTAFRQKNGECTNEQMMALLIVADQYGLNPWTREIYAFPDKNNGIVPVVGVDGWSRIINENEKLDGIDFNYGPNDANGIPEWIECVMYRTDRRHPLKVTEFFAECNRPGIGPWQTHPRRMLRHKAVIQCARLAFGFVGIYDEDEATRIVDATKVEHATPSAERVTPPLPELSQEEFNKQLPSWRAAIEGGKKSPSDILRLVQLRFSVPDEFQDAILLLDASRVKPDGEIIDAEFEQGDAYEEPVSAAEGGAA